MQGTGFHHPAVSSDTFDPFGERVVSADPVKAETGSHRGRRVAVAAFWSLAAAIVACRVMVNQPHVEAVLARIASAILPG